MNIYLLIGISAFIYLVCFFSLPILNKYGLKFGLIDKLESRKKNKVSLVRIGGLSIFFAFNLGILFLIIFKTELICHDFLKIFSFG